MYTYYKWEDGIHLFELVRILERIFLDLGWESRWGTKNGKPVFALNVLSWKELHETRKVNEIPLASVGYEVTSLDLLSFPGLLEDPDLVWELDLSFNLSGYRDDLVPLLVSCGYIAKSCPDWIDRDYTIRSDGILNFMSCDLFSKANRIESVDFYYRNFTRKNLPYYILAYEFTKELWNAVGADTCYGRHHKTGEPQIQSEPGLLFQFSRVEPVRLLLPLEEQRMPSDEEVEADGATPGLWHQAIGRRDLDVGQWDWKPRGLKALGIPKSKQEWEDAGFPEAIG